MLRSRLTLAVTLTLAGLYAGAGLSAGLALLFLSGMGLSTGLFIAALAYIILSILWMMVSKCIWYRQHTLRVGLAALFATGGTALWNIVRASGPTPTNVAEVILVLLASVTLLWWFRNGGVQSKDVMTV